MTNIIQIPKIDLAQFKSSNKDDKYKLAMQLDDACKKIGFFVVINHGIDKKVFEDIYKAMSTFFNLAVSEKNKCKPSEMGDNYMPSGYSGFREENAYAFMGKLNKPNDYVEKFSVDRDIHNDNIALPFPQNEFGTLFRHKIKNYYEACEEVIEHLIELFSLALDLPLEYFKTQIDKATDRLRLLNYPAFSNELENSQGCAPHKDATLLTLLTNNTPGLEVQLKDGSWIQPITNDIDWIIVNIGDLMMRWSNDTYISTPHRVILTDKKRQSIAFFKLANDNALIEAFPKFCIDKKAKYAPVTFKDFSLEKHTKLVKKN